MAIQGQTSIDPAVLDDVIRRPTEIRSTRQICAAAREIFLQQPNLLELEVPIKICVSNRLWRPAAQRNLRNQWSKLASLKQQWLSASNSGRSHATCLINAFLSQKYMSAIELGILLDMPDIKNKACSKLIKQQELNRSKLLSSYKDMVNVVTNMATISRSMRCFSKGTNSTSLVQFSSYSEDKDDRGDGGGISVFAFSSISIFEKFAKELVHMYELELILKRSLIVQLLSLSCEDSQTNVLSWSAELYLGEFNELSTCDLYSEETNEPIPPRLKDREFETLVVEFKHPPNREVLQVYLTTWLAEVNIDNLRVDEIFATIGEEMHITLK